MQAAPDLVEWITIKAHLDGVAPFVADALTELHLGNSRFLARQPSAGRALSKEERLPCALQRCAHLKQLSTKNAAWLHAQSPHVAEEVSQEMLIKVAWRHPALRWLRSGLREESAAMLQQERPEITFVSEQTAC